MPWREWFSSSPLIVYLAVIASAVALIATLLVRWDMPTRDGLHTIQQERHERLRGWGTIKTWHP